MPELPPSLTPPNTPRLGKWPIAWTDFGIYIAFTVAFVAALGGLAGQFLISQGLDLQSDKTLWPAFLLGAATQLGLLGGWAAFQAFVKPPDNRRPVSKRSAAVHALVAYPLIMLALIPINALWVWILDTVHYEYSEQFLVEILRVGGSPVELACMGVLIVIVAPVCEELAFRGTLFRYLHGRLKPWQAVTLGGALFAAFHANLYSFGPLVALGIALCLLYRRTANLLACISLHALFNLISFLAIVFLNIDPV